MKKNSLFNVRLPEVGNLLADEYLLTEVIARGGMGIVFLAEQKSMVRQVAVKVLLPHAIQDEAHRQRFAREIKVVQQLKHPNIIDLYDFAHTDDGNHFLVTEYLVGRDLKSLVKRVGPMAAGRALRLMIQVAKGLTEAHKANIIHRDLKPANIFVCDSEEGEFVKILDFGIAKSLDSGEPEVTKQGEVCGTTAYLAPEAILGHVGGKQVDVYSLGLILLELLLGRKVFHGRTIAETLVKQLRQNPPIPEVFVGTAIADLVLTATAKDPADRYPDATALLGALEFAINTVNPFRRATEGQVDELFSSLGVPVSEASWPQPSGVENHNAWQDVALDSVPTPHVFEEPAQTPPRVPGGLVRSSPALKPNPSLLAARAPAPIAAQVPAPHVPAPIAPPAAAPVKDFESLAREASLVSQQLPVAYPEEEVPPRSRPVTEQRSVGARFGSNLRSHPITAWGLVLVVGLLAWFFVPILFPDEPRAIAPTVLPAVDWKSPEPQEKLAQERRVPIDLVGTWVTSSPTSVEVVVDESTALTTPFRAFLTRDTSMAFRRKGYRTQTAVIKASAREDQHISMEGLESGSVQTDLGDTKSLVPKVPRLRNRSSASPREPSTKPRKKKRGRLRVRKL